MEHCVDSHAHIYLEKMRPDLDDIMARSAEVGIDQIYMPNIDHTSIDHMMEVEDKYPDLSLIHIPSPRDLSTSRMPSSA